MSSAVLVGHSEFLLSLHLVIDIHAYYFLSMKSVLDDDDVALIDLVSKADLGRQNAEKGSYYAETYDKNGMI